MALTKSLSFSLGRKRILISNNSCNLEQFSADFESFAPMMKRRCSEPEEIGIDEIEIDEFEQDFSRKSLLIEALPQEILEFRSSSSSKSLLEALPQEILIKIICGVDHDDLKKLFIVSKTVHEAAVIAKKSHFAYSTPSKTKAFRNSIDLVNNPIDFDDYEAPNAPKQARRKNRPRINEKKLGDISVALFSDENPAAEMAETAEQRWPRRSLFM